MRKFAFYLGVIGLTWIGSPAVQAGVFGESLNRFARWAGYGYSDGYHACDPKTSGPCVDGPIPTALDCHVVDRIEQRQRAADSAIRSAMRRWDQGPSRQCNSNCGSACNSNCGPACDSGCDAGVTFNPGFAARSPLGAGVINDNAIGDNAIRRHGVRDDDVRRTTHDQPHLIPVKTVSVRTQRPPSPNSAPDSTRRTTSRRPPTGENRAFRAGTEDSANATADRQPRRLPPVR